MTILIIVMVMWLILLTINAFNSDERLCQCELNIRNLWHYKADGDEFNKAQAALNKVIAAEKPE